MSSSTDVIFDPYGRLREHDVVLVDTHHGRVGTVAVFDRDLPRGAVTVRPAPAQIRREHSRPFQIQVITKAIGEYDRRTCPVEDARDWMFVRDIDGEHRWNRNSGGFFDDEGFYCFTVP